jgi:hypothetical protein
VDAGFRHLARIDHEILGEDRALKFGPYRCKIVVGPAEIRAVDQHADRVGRAAIGTRDRGRVGALAKRAFARRDPLHFHDEPRSRAGKRSLEALLRRHGFRTQRLERDAFEPRRHVVPLAGDDLAQDAFDLSHW